MQVTDPVCGMQVESDNAAKEVRQGQTYYFCSATCHNKFLAMPDLYVKKAGVAAKPPGS